MPRRKAASYPKPPEDVKSEDDGFIVTTVRLPKDLHADLRMRGFQEHRSMNDMIIAAVKGFYEGD